MLVLFDVIVRNIGVFQHDVMRATFYEARCRNKRQLGFGLKFADAESAAVAHGGTHLVQGKRDIVFQAAGIGNVGINAFFEG